jgi:hypothetical protein
MVKERALLKRVQVTRKYLEFMIVTKNTQRLPKQRLEATFCDTTPKLVALWTRDFMRQEPVPAPTPADAREKRVCLRPLKPLKPLKPTTTIKL